MRYQLVDIIVFRNTQGKSITIRSMREYPEYTDSMNIKVRSDDEIDEIASRQEIYGDEGEMESYKIFDANIINIFDAGFDISKLNKVRIPL